ncbi:hypothetical protein ABL78_7155 [Leptomonas seymouri]|uniref:Uncharacterized protein n=1 Tax=Leptomonas seymouri TaxID=5684 RepID=A0A0N0P3L5_LEPSE|nr:hypothetical protein ABL78_7155 [Leptomonas seymouri]|eukprot:KPI83807.1 hypothetical protein ABL78_7155 [Leptomonas seymouri]
MGRHNESGGGGEKSSSHRSRDHRDDVDSGHRHRRHHHRRHLGIDREDSNERARGDGGNRHRHRHHHHSSGGSRRREEERGSGRGDRSDAAARSRRRPRIEHRDGNRIGSDEYTDNEDDPNAESNWREREAERRSQRRSRRDDTDEGEFATSTRGRKRRRGRGGGGGSQSDEDSKMEEEADMSVVDDQRNRYQSDSFNSNVVDWSSRRGRRQMPSLAYDVGQQKRFLGFLDHRDASGGHASGSAARAAEMKFEIGPDGLVQMPPPNTLVRQQRSRRTGGGGRGEDRRQPPTYSTDKRREGNGATPRIAHAGHNGNGEDDNNSVASHESLYNDPATAHLGILPDILPPSNLYRVVLYGVDLSITPGHLTSIVTQLLGKAAKPYRARRPAREMLLAAISYSSSDANRNGTAPPEQSSSCGARPQVGSSTPVFSEGVLQDAHGNDSALAKSHNAPTSGVLNTAPSSGILPDAPAVLEAGDEVSGVLGNDGQGQKDGIADDCDEGVLPDATSLPLPPQPAAPAFYLPGLHDVNGPGGMVVLEFTDHEHAIRTVKVLNGGYVNGRRIAASM